MYVLSIKGSYEGEEFEIRRNFPPENDENCGNALRCDALHRRFEPPSLGVGSRL